MFTCVVGLSAIIWIALLLLPWRPWSTRERLVVDAQTAVRAVHEITVLIPARNEAACIARTLRQLAQQGRFARVVVIDDQSDDGTGNIAANAAIDELMMNDRTPPPARHYAFREPRGAHTGGVGAVSQLPPAQWRVDWLLHK